MEHIIYSIQCPRCQSEIPLELEHTATDWDEFDGCIGPMLEYRFASVPLTCSHCGAGLTLNGTISNSMGQITGTLKASSAPHA